MKKVPPSERLSKEIEDTLRDPETGELLLSKDEVSELTEEL
jgi:hypothetical protein